MMRMSTNTNPNAPYVLFYSKFCAHCRRAMEILKTHPLGRQSLYLCVDDKKGQLPPAVRAVPTMYDRRAKQYHIGEATFQFLQRMTDQGPSRSAAAPSQVMPAGGDDMGPGAYHWGEMNGFSDTYAYIDSQDALPKAFGYLTDNGGYGPAPQQAPSFTPTVNAREGTREQRGQPNMAPMMPSHGQPRMGSIPEMRPSRDERAMDGDIESAYEALLQQRKLEVSHLQRQ